MAYGNDFSSVAGDERGRMALSLQAQQAAQDAYFREQANRLARDQMAQQAMFQNAQMQQQGHFQDRGLGMQQEATDFSRARVPYEDQLRMREIQDKEEQNSATRDYWANELKTRMDIAKLGISARSSADAAQQADTMEKRGALAETRGRELAHLLDTGKKLEMEKMGKYKEWALGDYANNRSVFSPIVDKLTGRAPVTDPTTLKEYSPATATPVAAGQLRRLDAEYAPQVTPYKNEFEKWLAKLRNEMFDYDPSTGQIIDVLARNRGSASAATTVVPPEQSLGLPAVESAPAARYENGRFINTNGGTMLFGNPVQYK